MNFPRFGPPPAFGRMLAVAALRGAIATPAVPRAAEREDAPVALEVVEPRPAGVPAGTMRRHLHPLRAQSLTGTRH